MAQQVLWAGVWLPRCRRCGPSDSDRQNGHVGSAATCHSRLNALQQRAVLFHLQGAGRRVASGRSRVFSSLSLRWYWGQRYLPTTRLTTMAAMPASTALAIGDDRMSVIGLDPDACC